MLVLFACVLCMEGSESNNRQHARNKLVRGVRQSIIPTEQLKEMLGRVLQNKQMQDMAKDPHLVSGLMQLMKDPEKIQVLTHDAELAQSLHEMSEKDPEALARVMRDAGFEVPMSLEYVDGATLEEIHSEFSRITKSDKDHMQRLKTNVKLREDLKKTLNEVMASATAANHNLNTRLKAIRDGHTRSKSSLIVEQDGSMFGSDKVQELEELETSEEVQSKLREYGKAIAKEIEILHKQDGIELETLAENGEIRAALKERMQQHIKEQESELQFAADGEAKSRDTMKI